MKKWNVKSKTTDRDEIVSFLLKERGIHNEEEKNLFLNPLPTSELLKELSQEFKDQLLQASNIIKNSIQRNTPIVIHGDYDADGICSTAILFKVISEELFYKNVFAFIPNRFNHGYGLSKESVDESVEMLKKEDGGFTEALLITVDTGVTAVKEVDYAKSKGFKVVITDHHQKPDVLPGADCIVWNDSLVGAGVTWFLARALGSKDKGLIQYAATGTVTDLQPLLNINRSIVKEGLELMNKEPTLGIKKLIEVAGRKFPVSTYDLGWVIGPRLNAIGRIGDATDALNLLVTKDEAKALVSAKNLNELNFQRQEKTMEMYALVEKFKTGGQKIIFTSNKDYHEGIIGLVAAKLVQTHYRPAIVVSLDEEFGKGSVRSVSGFDVIAFLRKFEGYFESLGGHPMAAGFTIKVEKLEEFKKAALAKANKEISEELLVPVLNIDMEIPLDLVNMEFIEEIESLRPFGIGNKTPIFLSKGVSVTGINLVGKEKNHAALKLLAGEKVFRGIYFKGVDNVKDLEIGDTIDLVYSVEKNEFRNNVYVNLVVKDLKKT